MARRAGWTGQQQAHSPAVARGGPAGRPAPQEETPIRANVIWAMDFQFDTTADGRTLMRETRSHLCTVVDTGEVIWLITLNDVLERLLQSGDAAA